MINEAMLDYLRIIVMIVALGFLTVFFFLKDDKRGIGFAAISA